MFEYILAKDLSLSAKLLFYENLVLWLAESTTLRDLYQCLLMGFTL